MLVTGAEGQVDDGSSGLCGLFEITACSKKTLNITSAEDVRRAFEQIEPNIVVNAAAYTKVDDAEINFEMAEAVNSEAVKGSSKLQFKWISFDTLSTTVFDGENRGTYTEQSHPIH